MIVMTCANRGGGSKRHGDDIKERWISHWILYPHFGRRCRCRCHRRRMERGVALCTVMVGLKVGNVTSVTFSLSLSRPCLSSFSSSSFHSPMPRITQITGLFSCHLPDTGLITVYVVSRNTQPLSYTLTAHGKCPRNVGCLHIFTPSPLTIVFCITGIAP